MTPLQLIVRSYVDLLGKSMTFHDLQPVGDTMARATNDVREINYLVYPGINLVVGSANFLVMPLLLAPQYDWQLDDNRLRHRRAAGALPPARAPPAPVEVGDAERRRRPRRQGPRPRHRQTLAADQTVLSPTTSLQSRTSRALMPKCPCRPDPT